MYLIFEEKSVYLVSQHVLLVESLPHVSTWVFGGGEQHQTSSLLSGSLCSVRGDGLSTSNEKSIVLKE